MAFSGFRSSVSPTDSLPRQLEGESQSSIELNELCGGKGSEVLGERCLRKAHQLIAVDATVVLEALVNTDVDLGMQTVAPGVYGRAHDSRESGIEE